MVDAPLGEDDAAAVRESDGPLGGLHGERDELDPRAGGHDAGDGWGDNLLGRRRLRRRLALALAALARRRRGEEQGQESDGGLVHYFLLLS